MGEAFNSKDDIYSLGATYHLLFTGHSLFDGVEEKPVLPIVVVNAGATVAALQPEVPTPLNVGHFKVLGKRWEAGATVSSLSALGGSNGRWVEFEKFNDKVRDGDFVLKDSG